MTQAQMPTRTAAPRSGSWETRRGAQGDRGRLERDDAHQGALRNAASTVKQGYLAERAALERLGRLRPGDAEVRLLLARNRVAERDYTGRLGPSKAIERAPDNPALHSAPPPLPISPIASRPRWITPTSPSALTPIAPTRA